MTELRPIKNTVIVRQHDVEEETKGGIVLAGVEEKPMMGTVVAVGPGHWLGDKFIETVVEPGDVVMFGKNVGEEVELDHETTVKVMKEHLILAVLGD